MGGGGTLQDAVSPYKTKTGCLRCVIAGLITDSISLHFLKVKITRFEIQGYLPTYIRNRIMNFWRSNTSHTITNIVYYVTYHLDNI